MQLCYVPEGPWIPALLAASAAAMHPMRHADSLSGSTPLGPEQAGAIVTQSGDMVTQSGDMVTQSGDMVTQSGDMVTQSGDMVTQSGTIVTQSGDMVTRSGGMVRQSGGMVRQSGAPLPQRPSQIGSDLAAWQQEVRGLLRARHQREQQPKSQQVAQLLPHGQLARQRDPPQVAQELHGASIESKEVGGKPMQSLANLVRPLSLTHGRGLPRSVCCSLCMQAASWEIVGALSCLRSSGADVHLEWQIDPEPYSIRKVAQSGPPGSRADFLAGIISCVHHRQLGTRVPLYMRRCMR